VQPGLFGFEVRVLDVENDLDLLALRRVVPPLRRDLQRRLARVAERFAGSGQREERADMYFSRSFAGDRCWRTDTDRSDDDSDGGEARNIAAIYTRSRATPLRRSTDSA
jgi:hypothetical protein